MQHFTKMHNLKTFLYALFRPMKKCIFSIHGVPYGHSTHTDEENVILEATIKFVKDTKRFT